MIGVPVEDKLALTCERRLGQVVRAASTFNLHRVASPAGNLKPRNPLRLVLAMTDEDLWLLELRYWVVGFDVGAALCRFPRPGLVTDWRHRWWGWPAVWKAQLSWPALATYVAGSVIGGDDADRIIGLLAADQFAYARQLATGASA
jgi:hypothetical protein